MALHGINLPLAWIGFEKIMVEVFQDMGFSDADIADFISGPAFVAWNHFGNIQGSWGNATPWSWIDDQFRLQQRILQRMVDLGMTPILPSFPGYVPRAIRDVYPLANVSMGSTWEGFPTQYTDVTFLDPFDPLFEELQVRFISKQQSHYGNITNFWTLDQFNENDPSSGDPEYLERVSKNTWKSLKAADPDAIWVMQGWLFASNAEFWTNERVEAFLGGVEVDSDMLILDLFSESQPQWQRTSSFYGKPWIWCELHGYGGNYGLVRCHCDPTHFSTDIRQYGQIMNVTVNATEALNNSTTTLVGFGLSMEGLEGNEIMYDLLLDQAWSETSIDTESYFHDWVTTRYGASDVALPDGAYTAWEMLRTTVFNNTNLTANAVPKSIYELVPSTTGLVNRTRHHPTVLNYDPETLVAAWNLLYQAGKDEPELFTNPAYRYDIVDWTRQVLGNAFIPLYEQLVTTYTAPSHTSRKCTLKGHGKRMKALLLALDTVLSTDENFRLSTWISAARAVANFSDPDSPAIADFMEYEARNQVTLWGPTGQISDYASRSWSGLVSTYYIPRWQKFIDYLVDTPPDEYNQTEFEAELLEWELVWVDQNSGGTELLNSPDSLQTVLENTVNNWDSIFTL
jgi:alpha-N-acetylglucosaminidase